jgi:hypothetical protein
MTGNSQEVADAMRRLCAADRERYAAIEDLIRLEVVRSRRLVGDLGEAIAARYYRVALGAYRNSGGTQTR